MRWERRLKDAAQLLHQCDSSYFDPELFRMNTNQFLQTARIVTFIIQKNKADIPGYDEWYKRIVIDGLGGDPIMGWAKDSRNLIEKEGDLEMYSSLSASLIFSYIEADDVIIPCGRAELLGANVKRLARLARKVLPTGVTDAAVIKVERRWVANSLPTWELLHALTYVYARLYECCRTLALHLDSRICGDIPHPTAFDHAQADSFKARYFKLNSRASVSLKSQVVPYNRDVVANSPLRELAQNLPAANNLESNVARYSELAKALFMHDGHHVPMLFLFDEAWQVIDFVSTEFEDQAEKYIFWRSVAQRVACLRPYSILSIGELWLRDPKGYGRLPVRRLPIVGEFLEVLGMDKGERVRSISWQILRDEDGSVKELEEISPGLTSGEGVPNFLLPIRDALKKVWSERSWAPNDRLQ